MSVTTVALSVGDRLRLAPDGRRWWTVQAVSEHFTACVQQVPFQRRGVLRYTVLDWRSGVRGPCNLIGQGWGDGTYSEAECRGMLVEFERIVAVCPARGDVPAVEVSHRNRVPLDVLEVRT